MTDGVACIGDCVEVVKVRTRQVAVLKVEVPVEAYKQAVQFFDGNRVLVTPTKVDLPDGVHGAMLGDANRIPPASVSNAPSPYPSPETGSSEPERKTAFAELPLVQQAALMCKDDDFQTFAVKQAPYPDNLPPSENAAAVFVRRVCRVKSRSKLLPGTDAGERWIRLHGGYRLARRMRATSSKQYLGAVAESGCVICQRPAQVHHGLFLKGAALKSNWWDVIPLCPDHHTDGGPGVALHDGVETWEGKYGRQHDLVLFAQARIEERLMLEGGR